MPESIRITKDLILPLSLFTDAMAVFGRRGSGKTNTAAVLVEHALDAGVQVVILDPKDEWYGLRSSRSGKQAAYRIPVLGGHSPDALPLGEHDGAALADLLVTERLPAVICTQTLPSTAAEKRFARDFCTQLLKRKAEPKYRSPLLMVFEEARRFAPQRVDKDETKLLKAVVEIIRLGRTYGFGALLIDQRPASVHKDVMQLELLVCHQITTPHDRKALKEWVQANDAEDREQEFLGSLASLAKGEAWFWAPAYEDLFQRVSVPLRKTFDASVTPGVGQDVTPQRLASFDQTAFAKQLAATIEQQKADDPAELKRQIASLKKELVLQRAKSETPVVDEGAVATAVGKAIVRRDLQWHPLLDEANRSIHTLRERLRDVAEAAETTVEECPLVQPPSELPEGVEAVPRGYHHGGAETRSTRGVAHRTAPPRDSLLDNRQPRRTAFSEGETDLRPAHQRILNALAWLAVHGLDRPDRSLVAAVAGVSPRSSSYRNDVSRLSSLGLVAYPQQGNIRLTDAGANLARAPEQALSLADYHQAWRDCPALRRAHVRLLDVVIDQHPGAISRDDLAEFAGVSPASSSFRNDVSRLSSFGLIRYPEQGYVAATELLFPVGLA